MHLLIPFAVPLSEPGRQALARLPLPQLQALLHTLQPVHRDAADEWSFSPPHERARARVLGLAGGSGQLPWAALAAQADGVDTGDLAWGLVTPAHWHLGTEQVSLLDPELLLLDERSSRVLFDAVQPLFTGDGFALHWGAPLRWYAAHECLARLPTASLDRVIGRNVDRFLVSEPAHQAQAGRVRRLQAEVQMLLYTHPLNDERQARGLHPVNSFWLSGCGAAQPVAGPAPQVAEPLRTPALAEDWAAWALAWEHLDAQLLAPLVQRVRAGEPVQLTLCGERQAVTWANAAAGAPAPAWWSRLRRSLSPPPLWPQLEPL